MNSTMRRAFTLVELLVVISIIGMLMALLLPAVQAAREAGRRAVCMNNQRNLGMALINYEGVHRRFPGYRNFVGRDRELVGSWVVPILPQLDRNDLYRSWNELNQPTAVSWDLFACPSDPGDGTAGQISYVVNCGRVDSTYLGNLTNPFMPSNRPDRPETGVFHDRTHEGGARMSLDFIGQRDGASNTILLSERRLPAAGSNRNHDRPLLSDSIPPERTWFAYAPVSTFDPTVDLSELQFGFTWFYGNNVNVTPDSDYPNDRAARISDHISSRHGGVIVTTYCDGRVQLLSQNTDYRVYVHLMTPDSRGSFAPAHYDLYFGPDMLVLDDRDF